MTPRRPRTCNNRLVSFSTSPLCFWTTGEGVILLELHEKFTFHNIPINISDELGCLCTPLELLLLYLWKLQTFAYGWALYLCIQVKSHNFPLISHMAPSEFFCSSKAFMQRLLTKVCCAFSPGNKNKGGVSVRQSNTQKTLNCMVCRILFLFLRG